MKDQDEREADKRAKKAIAKIEIMKLKRQEKSKNSSPVDSSIGMGTKVTFVIAIVMGLVVYMRDHSLEQTKFSFAEAKSYCEEQGKLLPLALDDDPQHLLNIRTVEEDGM